MPNSDSLEFDGTCPSCGRRFPNNSGVLRHMNNPSSSCTSWFDYLKSISTESTSEQPHQPPPQSAPSNDEMDSEDTTADDCAPTTTHFEDIYPSSPSIFGFGQGFMDGFYADHHAEKRGANIYYPFSSKEEWGLASWLLCSGLSMRAIDDFLALPMVCFMTRDILHTY